MSIHLETYKCPRSRKHKNSIIYRTLVKKIFIEACKKSLLDVVSDICWNNRDQVEDVMEDGLYESCNTGNLVLVKYLVTQGAKLWLICDRALIVASKNGYPEIVKYLIKNGANVHTQYDSALQHACMHNHFDIVKILIAHGADVNAGCGYALAMTISRTNNLVMAKYLLDHGANIHENQDMAFREACSHGKLDAVKFLISHGANIHANYDSALGEACVNGHLDMVKFLVEHNANIHYCDDLALRNASIKGHLKIVKFLVESGANVNAHDSWALQCAINNDHFDVAKYLIKTGAQITVSMLRCSAFDGNLARVKFLAKHKCFSREDYDSALEYALESNVVNDNSDMINFLTKQRQNLNASVICNVTKYLIKCAYKIINFNMFV